jgi:hypothetical protein
MTPQQMAEKLRNDIHQLRLRLQQQVKDSETLSEQLKLVRISQLLQSAAFWESAFPDLSSIPPQLKPAAAEVQQLLGEVKQQLAQKSFLDTQVNELQKRSKSLGRTGDTLQATIDEMRAKQRAELAAVDVARDRMQRLESETAALREQVQAAALPRTAAVSAEDLHGALKKIALLEEQIRVHRRDHERLVADLGTNITDYNRRLDDASSADTVMKKKISQKVSALQTEINKRRGIVVHSSRRTTGADSAQLFLESKRLIQDLATAQQDVWEVEERLAFSRNSLDLLAGDLVKKILGRFDPAKAAQTTTAAKEIVLRLAAMDRDKKALLSASR